LPLYFLPPFHFPTMPCVGLRKGVYLRCNLSFNLIGLPDLVGPISHSPPPRAWTGMKA
jgi:hypothetical protein